MHLPKSLSPQKSIFIIFKYAHMYKYKTVIYWVSDNKMVLAYIYILNQKKKKVEIHCMKYLYNK